jgi:hypothetical protein
VRLAVIPIPSTRPDGSLFDSTNLRQLLDIARLAEDVGFDAL